ncbi:LacI family DNA-binding transcriptional regulator [Actinospica sp. MGRD01-02]|uniref:LacI family DNA-binding transcriptional regulator n=1 Tax=Actinospica acidithermotolerans TaxID=2828514 RepID=A0A941ECD8_9ACTN|nr:LacI family DNA-binding transcriptional regulator [Actinospica acidithermotolerans]MBR7828861.1 LacI family DNA-binding transcriptional regulator [Actinospica acidithermotolerans]
MARRVSSTETERATIRDVAARAGVSPATAARVVAGDYPVAAATRAKVQRAMRELDYVPNAQARALAKGGTKTVAFLVDDITGPSFAYVAKAVEEQAAAEGRLCMVCTTHGDPARELAILETMREHSADAVILVGSGWLDEAHRSRLVSFAHALDKSGSRLVLAGQPQLGPDVPATVVEYDNTGGAYAISSYLLSLGHRRIAFVGADRPDEAPSTTKAGRLGGFVRAHEAHGVEHDPELVVPSEFTREMGARATKRLLATGREFTAVFAATDMVAAGVLAVLREAGLRVPEDVSLVGYDDIPLALDLWPPLTTVHVPTEELGRAAVRLALHPEEPQHLVLGTHIVIRGSAGPAPGPSRG